MPMSTDEKPAPEVVDCVSLPVQDELAHRASVAMSIDTAGLQFKIDTKVDQSTRAVELAAQLQMALDLLNRSDSRLEAALIEIGQLRAQLQMLREISVEAHK